MVLIKIKYIVWVINLKVYFRTNFDRKIGIGHLSRTYNLYLELKKIYKCKVVIDSEQKNIPFFKNSKNLLYLYGKNKFESEKKDAELFIKKNLRNKKNIVIVDDYRLGKLWEKKISPYASKIVAIDDFIQRKHCADILVNTKPELNIISPETLKVIKNYNKNGAELLLGSKYSIINNLFAKKNNIKNRKSFNITFYNGGSGNILIYAKIIKLITKIQKKVTINLVCGPFAKNTNFVISKYKKKRNIKIINKNEDFYKTLINTNLLVGSCGLISFEAAKIKLPSILFVMNENQKINKNTLEEIGHYFILDKKDIKNSKKVAALIMICFQNYKRIKRIMNQSKFDVNHDGKKLIIKSILKKK